MKSKSVEFQPPKDAAIPEGVSAGEEFDLVCSFRVKDNGTVCMTRMGDAEMPCGGEKTGLKKADKPGYGDMAKGMMTMET